MSAAIELSKDKRGKGIATADSKSVAFRKKKDTFSKLRYKA